MVSESCLTAARNVSNDAMKVSECVRKMSDGVRKKWDGVREVLYGFGKRSVGVKEVFYVFWKVIRWISLCPKRWFQGHGMAFRKRTIVSIVFLLCLEPNLGILYVYILCLRAWLIYYCRSSLPRSKFTTFQFFHSSSANFGMEKIFVFTKG